MPIVERFVEAFNGRDVEGLLGCFTDDATYADLLLGETAAGRDGLRALFERMMRESGEVEWTIERVAASAELEMAEWRFRIVISDAIPRSAGRTLSLRGASVFEVRDGRCCAYREYFDRGVGLVQLGLEAAPLHRVLSRQPSAAGKGA